MGQTIMSISNHQYNQTGICANLSNPHDPAHTRPPTLTQQSSCTKHFGCHVPTEIMFQPTTTRTTKSPSRGNPTLMRFRFCRDSSSNLVSCNNVALIAYSRVSASEQDRSRQYNQVEGEETPTFCLFTVSLVVFTETLRLECSQRARSSTHTPELSCNECLKQNTPNRFASRTQLEVSSRRGDLKQRKKRTSAETSPSLRGNQTLRVIKYKLLLR